MSTRKVGSERVPKRLDSVKYRKGGIRVSTGKVGSEQVPERRDPGRYRKGGVWASTGKVGSEQVPERWDPGRFRKCGIRASTEKVGSGQVPKIWDPGEMLENPKQAKRSKQTRGKWVGLSMTSKVCQQMTQISQKSNTIMIKEGGMPPYDNRKGHK